MHTHFKIDHKSIDTFQILDCTHDTSENWQYIVGQVKRFGTQNFRSAKGMFNLNPICTGPLDNLFAPGGGGKKSKLLLNCL